MRLLRYWYSGGNWYEFVVFSNWWFMIWMMRKFNLQARVIVGDLEVLKVENVKNIDFESATLQPSSWKVWLLKSLPPARGSSVHVSSWGQLHLHCHKWWLHVQWKQTWPQSPDWRPVLWFLEERLGEHLYTSAPKWSNFNSISTDAGESGKHDGQSPFQNGLSRGEYTEGTVCDEFWNHSCH